MFAMAVDGARIGDHHFRVSTKTCWQIRWPLKDCGGLNTPGSCKRKLGHHAAPAVTHHSDAVRIDRLQAFKNIDQGEHIRDVGAAEFVLARRAGGSAILRCRHDKSLSGEVGEL